MWSLNTKNLNRPADGDAAYPDEKKVDGDTEFNVYLWWMFKYYVYIVTLVCVYVCSQLYCDYVIRRGSERIAKRREDEIVLRLREVLGQRVLSPFSSTVTSVVDEVDVVESDEELFIAQSSVEEVFEVESAILCEMFEYDVDVDAFDAEVLLLSNLYEFDFDLDEYIYVYHEWVSIFGEPDDDYASMNEMIEEILEYRRYRELGVPYLEEVEDEELEAGINASMQDFYDPHTPVKKTVRMFDDEILFEAQMGNDERVVVQNFVVVPGVDVAPLNKKGKKYNAERYRRNRDVRNLKKKLKKAFLDTKNVPEEFLAEMLTLGDVADFFRLRVGLGDKERDVVDKLVVKLDRVIKTVDDPPTRGSPFVNALEDMAGAAGQSAGRSAGMEVLLVMKETFIEFAKKYGAFVLLTIIASAIAALLYKYGYTSAVESVIGAMACSLFLWERPDIGNALISLCEYLKNRVVKLCSPGGSKEEEFVAQSFQTAEITDVVAMFLGYYTMPKVANGVEFLKYVTNLGRALPAAENVVCLVVRILQKIMDYGAIKLGYSSFEIVTTLMPRVDLWVKDSKQFICDFAKGKIHHDQAAHDVLYGLEDRAYELLTVVASDRKNPTVGPIIGPILKGLENLRVSLANEGVCEYKTRQAPVVGLMSGESQIGKTFLLRSIVAALVAITQNESERERYLRDPDAFVYPRVPTNPYWDGYFGQLFTFYDEKDLTHKDLLTAENADSELISTGNTFPMMLHMASLNQKGNTYFRSKFIIGTTNVYHSSMGAMHTVRYPLAVVNRIHIEVNVRVKREFATAESLAATDDPRFWNLDHSKIPKGVGVLECEMHDYMLMKMVRVPGTPNQRQVVEDHVISLEEVIKIYAMKYFEKEREALAVPLQDSQAYDYGLRLREKYFSTKCDVPKAQMADDQFDTGFDVSDEEDFSDPVMMKKLYAAFGNDVQLVDGIKAWQCGELKAYQLADIFFLCRTKRATVLDPYMCVDIWKEYVVEKKYLSKGAYRELKMTIADGYHDSTECLIYQMSETDRLFFFKQYEARYQAAQKTIGLIEDVKNKCENAFKSLAGYTATFTKYMSDKCDKLFGVPDMWKHLLLFFCLCTTVYASYVLFAGKLIEYVTNKFFPGGGTSESGFLLEELTVDNKHGNVTTDLYVNGKGQYSFGFFINPNTCPDPIAQSGEDNLDAFMRANIDGWLVKLKEVYAYDPKMLNTSLESMKIARENAMALVREVTQDKREVVAQMFDPTLESVVRKVWAKSYYSIRCANLGIHYGWGFFSHANVFNFCLHYSNIWKANEVGEEPIHLVRDGKPALCLFKKDFFEFTKVGVDHGTIVVKKCENHPDIRELYADVSDLVIRPSGVLMVVKKQGDAVVNIFTRYAIDFKTIYKDSKGLVYKLPVGIRYEMKTQPGDCGMPLFLVDPTTRNKKFIGFHVAGHTGFGLGAVFSAKDEDAEMASAQNFEHLPVSMKKIGTIPRPIGTSGFSAIRRSKLWGAWGKPKKKPSRLRPFLNEEGVRVYPMQRALLRYDKEILVYDQDLVEVCVHDAVAANTDGFPFRDLPKRISLEVAAAGMPGVEFMDAMNRSTSSGYPWSLSPRPGFKGKERFLGKNPEIDFSGPDWPLIVAEVEKCEQMLLRGERPKFYFSDSLKDELVKESKYLSGDTRLFCASPVAYLLLFNMYFKEFAAKFMSNRIVGEHIVGVNVYSEEWELLFRRLTVFGLLCLIAGDFRFFDASQAAQILKQIGEEVIKVFIDREYDGVRRLLWMEVYNSIHICGFDIIAWAQSLPSGHPMTTIINCLFVCTVFRMCYIHLQNNQLDLIKNFRRDVVLKAYGDDQNVAVEPTVLEWFNQHTITEAMAHFGLVYTPEDKDAVVGPSRSIYEIQFISRSFRYEPLLGRHVAPLKLQSILDMPMWTKKNGAELITITNFDNALRELSLHTEEVFNEWAPQMLRAAMVRLNYTPALVSRKALIFDVVKKEIDYSNRLGLYLGDPYLVGKTKNPPALDLEGLGKKHVSEENNETFTAEMGEPLCIYTYFSRMGCVKHYPGDLGEAWLAQVSQPMSIPPAVNLNNNQMGISTSDGSSQVGSTSVITSVSGVKATRDNFGALPGGLSEATQVGYQQMNIADFLKKPIILTTLAWDSTHLAGAILVQKDVPEDVYTIPIYADKMRGFLGFRATTRMRLMVNGNRFQMGRLLMVYVPQGQVLGTVSKGRVRHLLAATQLPRVELDVSTQTEVIMDIPYVSPTPFFNLKSGDGPIGRVFVLVYSPLAVGTGVDHADLTLWLNFENVELVAPAVAQMADLPKQELTIMEGPGPSAVNAVSKAVGSVKDAAARLASLATRPSWAISALAYAAASYGFSKPTSETAPTKIQQMFNFNMQNHNGVDLFPNMGLEATNRLELLPGGAGSNLDEMSVSMIAQKPAFVSQVIWGDANAPGDQLTAFDVTPNYGTVLSTAGIYGTAELTPLGMMAELFQFWRGSMVLTIKIVKTQYHSGRIMVVYNPVNLAVNSDQSSYLLREIIDIRETGEFKFVIPYTSTRQYLSTGQIGVTAPENIGAVTVIVLNDLVHPDTVADNVKLLFEWSAGPDIEFACPKRLTVSPLVDPLWMAEMDDSRAEGSVDTDMIVKGIGTSSIQGTVSEPALYCMGEKINSVKQLLNRYNHVESGAASTPTAALNFRPFYLGVDSYTDGFPNSNPLSQDMYCTLTACFAYVRGSVRVLVVPMTGSAVPSVLSYTKPLITVFPADALATALYDNSDPLDNRGIAVNYQYGITNQPVGCTVPPYQQYHVRLVRCATQANPEPNDHYTSKMRVCIETLRTGVTTTSRVFRAMGDDASLSFFLGVPQMRYYTTV